MAKPATPQAASKPANKTPIEKTPGVTVIYRPLDVTDPNVTRWNGIVFQANVPVELDPKNPAHRVMQLLPIEYPGQNGETLTRHKEQSVFMGDMARTNPSFEVDGKRAGRKVSTRIVPPPGAEWTDANEGSISDSDEVDGDATRDFMAA